MMLAPYTCRRIVFFTGAGMSAESGVPTYRGHGGIWNRYRWEEFACQRAFELDPEKVLAFHELRREAALGCQPHAGHRIIAALERRHPSVTVVTQNIDGMHQRAGSRAVLELHGSLWRLRCANHGVREDLQQGVYAHQRCEDCGAWLRPDITWFEDPLDSRVFDEAAECIRRCDLFIAVGTSGAVWPAAGLPAIARDAGARCIEINPEDNDASPLYPERLRALASFALTKLFGRAMDEPGQGTGTL